MQSSLIDLAKKHIFAKLKKRIVFLFLFYNVYWVLNAQTKVEIISTEELTGIKSGNDELQKLTGNVVLKHENAIMRCDSAYLNKKQNSFEAFGNVNINESDSVILNSQYLLYEGKIRKAWVRKNVTLSDGQMLLETDELEYDLNTRTAYYFVGGHILNGDNTLDSKIGVYNANTKLFSFKKAVKLVNPEYVLTTDTLLYHQVNKLSWFFGPTLIKGVDGSVYCENGWYNTYTQQGRFSRNALVISKEIRISADSLLYGGLTGIDTALGNIRFDDTLNHLVVTGQHGIYNRNISYSKVTGKPLAAMKMEEDTLFIAAELLESLGDSSGKKSLFADNQVQLYKLDFQGVCDSMAYIPNDSSLFMMKDPILWNEANQIKADSIRLWVVNQNLEKAWFVEKAFISEQIDSQLYNQMRGKIITAWFENKAIKQALVQGNAENIYFQEDDDTTVSSMNRIAATEIMLLFDSLKKLEEVTYRLEPNGTNYPLEPLPDEEKRFLPGFLWQQELRPKGKGAFRYP